MDQANHHKLERNRKGQANFSLHAARITILWLIRVGIAPHVEGLLGRQAFQRPCAKPVDEISGNPALNPRPQLRTIGFESKRPGGSS